MNVVQPSPFVQQVSGRDPEGRLILAVLAKRTYSIGRDGRCVPTPPEDSAALKVEPELESDHPGLLACDSDLFPFKPATDVVVVGHAYGRGAPGVTCSVQVGRYRQTLAALGDRRCSRSATGAILFSEPEPFEKVPLRYDRAYGGKDLVAEAKHGDPWEPYRKRMPAEIDLTLASPYLYPRNPAGLGYVIEATPEALEHLRLPNLEDAQDRLTPDRLAVGRTGAWPAMPLPQALTWVHHSWFPRLVHFGFIAPHDPLDGPVAEVQRGFAPADLMRPGTQAEKFSFRWTNGASLGLQLPHLAGNEEVVLNGLHPKWSPLSFRLPGNRPRIWTDGRNGKLNSTTPVLHTVAIEPDLSRVHLVWRGSAEAIRPYMPEELKTMPLKVEW